MWSLYIVSATGILKGYDQLLNLVLDGTTEFLQGAAYFNLYHCEDVI